MLATSLLRVTAALALCAAGLRAQEIITVRPEIVKVDRFLGFGFQYDAYHRKNATVDESKSAAQHAWIQQRVAFMRPGLVRICTQPFVNSGGWDYLTSTAPGDGDFINESSVSVQELVRNLTLCQNNGIDVLLCTWGRGQFASFTDPNLPKAQAQLFAYLRNTLGFTCIKYLGIRNEASHGDAPTFADWKALLQAYAAECSARGLDLPFLCDDNGDGGPFLDDGDNDATVSGLVGIWGYHYYVNDDTDPWIDNEAFTEARQALLKVNDLANDGEPVGWAEAGNQAMRDGGEVLQDHIGTQTADMAIQGAKAGLRYIMPWDLDDGVYEGQGVGFTNGAWGMIDSSVWDGSKGQTRPWFFPYSLLCRFFGKGTQIVDSANATQLRTLVARKRVGSNYHWSIAVVNRGTARSLVIKLPGVGSTQLAKYEFLEGQPRTFDANGLPTPATTVTVNLSATGLTPYFSGPGVIIWTTTSPVPFNEPLVGVLEAENLPYTTSDTVTVFADTLASGGATARLDGNTVNDWVEFTANVPEGGTYRVYVEGKTGADRAQGKLKVGNRGPLLTMDQYDPQVEFATWSLGDYLVPIGGDRKFRFTATGKNTSSSNYRLSFDAIALAPAHEAENLDVAASSGKALTVFTVAEASGGAHRLYSSDQVGDYVEFVVPVLHPATYEIRVRGYAQNNRATMRLNIGGVNGTTFDQYAATAGYQEWPAGTFTISAIGDTTLRFTVQGKNASSSNYRMNFDEIVLRPLY